MNFARARVNTPVETLFPKIVLFVLGCLFGLGTYILVAFALYYGLDPLLAALKCLRGPGVSAAAQKPKAKPTTKAELKLWLFRHTHCQLPSEDQPLAFYEALYARHCDAARPEPSAVAAAPPAAAAAAASTFVDGAGAVQSLDITTISRERRLSLIAAASTFAVVFRALFPSFLVSLTRAHPFDAGSALAQLLAQPQWVAEGVGAGFGAWLVGLPPPRRGWLECALILSTAASAAVTLHAPLLIRGLLLPSVYFFSPLLADGVLSFRAAFVFSGTEVGSARR